MKNLSHFYINGQWVSPEKPNDFIVENPSNERQIGIISLGTSVDVDKAVTQLETHLISMVLVQEKSVLHY